MPIELSEGKRKKILITGGSGLIGRNLTALLIRNGYPVFHLGRTRKTPGVKTFIWDLTKREIEAEALQDVDVIIHLAGAGIADVRWTSSRKREILESRKDSAQLLKDTLRKVRHRVTTFISASGISYYGLGQTHKPYVETDAPADDFMARVAIAWEHEVQALGEQGIRVVSLRTGVVLSREGGALKRLEAPIKFFVGAPLGTGKQYVNWIHIDDLCSMYLKAVEDESMYGPYNAVAPHPITNEDLTREIAEALGRTLWLPPVPGFAVKLIAGDVAELILKGGRISSEKIENAGFAFRFRTVREALKAIYARQ